MNGHLYPHNALAPFLQDILEGLQLPITYLYNPEKRIFWLYLLSSVLLAYYVFRRSGGAGSFLSYLFPKNAWLGSSAMVDYGLLFLNGLVKVLLIGPYFVFGFGLGIWIEDILVAVLGYPGFLIPEKLLIVLYTVALTLFMDLSTYLVHLIMHRVPFLWEYHKIHHSATTLTPLTQYRIHPIELLINNAKAIFVMGTLTGLFTYLSPHPLDEVKIIGANIFSFAFLFWGANLRHSHVKLTYPSFLEKWVISPYQHQIHHSDRPEHFNKNLGAKLAIWDRMFGTLIRSQEANDIQFGIGDENVEYRSVGSNLLLPFVKSVKALLRIGN